jgi:hypothetical protein
MRNCVAGAGSELDLELTYVRIMMAERPDDAGYTRFH